MKKADKNLITDLLLLPAGIATIFSGFLLQIKYHMGRLPKTTEVLSADYYDWTVIHKYSSVVFFIILCVHIYLHKEWYISLFKKIPVKRDRTSRLAFILIITSLFGFIPWGQSIINSLLGHPSAATERIFVEIHDKLGIILMIKVIMHVWKRFGWIVKRITGYFNKSRQAVTAEK
jgi:hypothetical protein